jgi:hypothetical protein
MTNGLRTADLVNIVSPPGWMGDAACAEIGGDEWFPDKGGSTREAKRICARCPVRAECLDYALAHDERFGIWGGVSERERRRIKRPALDPQRDGLFEEGLLDELIELGYARPVGGGRS